MSLIKHIEIAGFRGIHSPLRLSFDKNGAQSMIVLGRNGHGKSSITDSWEWLHTGDIERLKREHAGHSSFPHRGVVGTRGQCYVAVELADGRSLRQSFNHKRIKIPDFSGDVTAFRAAIPHPCQLRYEDLNRFVYKTKGEQYDALAKLMGFQPQVSFQKMLKRVLRQVEEKLQQQTAVQAAQAASLAAAISVDDLRADTVVQYAAGIANRHSLAAPKSIDEAKATAHELRDRVANDPRAQEIANLGTIQDALKRIGSRDGIAAGITVYRQALEQFQRRERKAVELLLINLYEQGQQVIEARVDAEQENGDCPLCGKHFDGDLLEHLKGELDNLKELKTDRDSLDATRQRLLAKLKGCKSAPKALEEGIKSCREHADELGIEKVVASMTSVDEVVENAISLVEVPVDQGSEETVASLGAACEALAAADSELTINAGAVRARITERIGVLNGDNQRMQLANDHASLVKAIDGWDRLCVGTLRTARLLQIVTDFRSLVEGFIKASNAEVASRFTRISADVAKYFGILEHHATNLAAPALRLIEDEDRAVTLEISFLGEVISPAYKYLSESQLNSFGLAIFLASARQFNVSFRFLILDDIVNSFDGYKRPQLIQLLKTEFEDFQLLLLTHDEVWAERLFKSFPKWVRTRFTRYEANIGPVIGDGLSDLEKIDRDIADGEAVRAGQLLGPLLERELQELCESCQGAMTYNRRNEYTLQPLLVSLRMRLEGKLNGAHPACIAIKALEADQGFRNLCAHWKNPSIGITPEELKSVVDKWRTFATQVQCAEEKCGEYVAYDGVASFKCRCGKALLTKA